MDPQARPSFIPKQTAPLKTPPVRRRRSVSVFSTLVFIVLLGVLIVSGGIFAYQQIIERNIQSHQAELANAREAFKPAVIEELRRLDARMSIAHNLVRGHIAPSRIFDLFEEITVENVQFETFSFSRAESGRISVQLGGKAQNFNAVALQSELFKETPSIEDILIANVSVSQADPETGEKFVNFQVDARLSEDFINASTYEQPLLNEEPDLGFSPSELTAEPETTQEEESAEEPVDDTTTEESAEVPEEPAAEEDVVTP